MFHATCENQLDVVFNMWKTDIIGISAILDYNPNDIEILKIVWENEKANNLSYVVNDNKIVLNKLKSDEDTRWWADYVTFSIYLKSKEWVSDTKISFAEGSYIVWENNQTITLDQSIVLQFVSVPECDPDIVSPKVNLLFPKEDSRVALDSYFQFDISDEWKWLNEDDIIISIDGKDYNINTMDHEWDHSVLTIYPDFWMPLNTWFELKISVSDKQLYGWANTVTKFYNLETPDELYLLNNITPAEYRKVVNNKKYYKWTKSECDFLSNNYFLADNDTHKKDIISSISKRINCPEFKKDENLNILDEEKTISVFSVIWRLLFSSLLLVVILLGITQTKNKN